MKAAACFYSQSFNGGTRLATREPEEKKQVIGRMTESVDRLFAQMAEAGPIVASDFEREIQLAELAKSMPGDAE